MEMNTDVKNIKMNNFCKKIGMTLESIKKEHYRDNISSEWISDSCYVLFEDEWKNTKNILQILLSNIKESYESQNEADKIQDKNEKLMSLNIEVSSCRVSTTGIIRCSNCGAERYEDTVYLDNCMNCGL